MFASFLGAQGGLRDAKAGLKDLWWPISYLALGEHGLA